MMPGRLSIQIDTCENIPQAEKSMTVTATGVWILSPDRILKPVNNSKCFQDRVGAPCDRIGGGDDRKQSPLYSTVGVSDKEKDHA